MIDHLYNFVAGLFIDLHTSICTYFPISKSINQSMPVHHQSSPSSIYPHISISISFSSSGYLHKLLHLYIFPINQTINSYPSIYLSVSIYPSNYPYIYPSIYLYSSTHPHTFACQFYQPPTNPSTTNSPIGARSSGRTRDHRSGDPGFESVSNRIKWRQPS